MGTNYDVIDAIRFTRERLSQFGGADFVPTKKATIALVCSIQERWPKSKKSKHLRHAVIMALLGRPITSQKELTWYQTKLLLEVLHDPDFGESCWSGLQGLVEGQFATEPWNIPATREGDGDVRPVSPDHAVQ